MEYNKSQFELANSMSQLQLLDQTENIFRDTQEDVEIENRLETLLEVSESTRSEQESIRLIDRIRNTENEISIMLNCSIFPVVSGNVRFSSVNFVVLQSGLTNYFVNLSKIVYLICVDQRAIFRTEDLLIDTTTMWLKNLIDNFAAISIYLTNGIHMTGYLIRFSKDHVDMQINQNLYLIPFSAIVLIRCNYEA